LPNARLVGLALNNKLVAWPVPERLIVNGEGVPLVVSAIEPLTALAEVGANVALNVIRPPGAMVVAVLSPVCPKPAPVTPICENVSVLPPLFVRMIDCELVVPSATVPNATLEGFAEICAEEVTVSARFAVPVPLALVALRPTLTFPELVGVPEISPLAVLIARPLGKPDAPKLVGEFVALI